MPSRSPATPHRAKTLQVRLGTHFPPTAKLPKILPPDALVLIAPLDNDFPGMTTVVISSNTVQLWGRHLGDPWKPMSPAGEWEKPLDVEPLVLAAREAAGVRWYIRPLAIARQMLAESGFRDQQWTFRAMATDDGWKVDCYFEGEVLPKEWMHHRPGMVSPRSTAARLMVQQRGLKLEGGAVAPAPLLLDDIRTRVDAERTRVQELLESGYAERMWQLWSTLCRDFEIGLDADLTPGFEFAVRLKKGEEHGSENTRVVVTAGNVLHQVFRKSEWECIAAVRSWLPGIHEICRKFLLQEFAEAQGRIVRPDDGMRQFVLNL